MAESSPLVSVNMPCYHQLPYARSALQSILAQSYPNIEITLIDDGASDEYRDYVASLRDPRVQYHRNPARLGAMRNMFGAMVAGRGKYTIAFHEDDLLSRGYVAAAVDVLERHDDCAFVAAELRDFSGELPLEDLTRVVRTPRLEFCRSGAEFVRALCRGVQPMFGSVVYRRSAVTGIRPLHDDYATLVDRPFLLAMLASGSAAIIRDPLAWYRRAGADDTRHLAMTTEHIIRLFQAYKAALPQPLSTEDAGLFYAYSGYWLFELYDLTPEEGRPSFRQFLFRVWREGLYQPAARGRFGLRLIRRALLGAAAQTA